jgi:hypothetical protein
MKINTIMKYHISIRMEMKKIKAKTLESKGKMKARL